MPQRLVLSRLMQFHRYMGVDEFARELDRLHAFRGRNVGTGLLELLEGQGLLIPRLRIRYPDPVARRFWLMAHEHWAPRELRHPIEPDGPRWDSAIELDEALYRWRNSIVYGPSINPLDDPAARFSEFIQHPSAATFETWLDMRVDISNDVETTLFDGMNVETYYSTWQILLAAEMADAGVHIRINLGDETIGRRAIEALEEGRLPEGSGPSFNFTPFHAARGFAKHQPALDAVVWFAEERWRVLSDIIKGQGGGRFRLSPAQSAQYEQETVALAATAVGRFNVSIDHLVSTIRFLSERWSEWKREGRPLIVDAYQAFLRKAVVLARQAGDMKFAELRDRVGRVGGWFKPALDVIWPDWSAQEKERVHLTLKASLTKKSSTGVSEADITAFVDFLASQGQEAFFWRLRSFEEHALRGNEFAIEGMKSDVQELSVVVEHIAAALGGTGTQLFQKFRQLWRDPQVLHLLDRNDVSNLRKQFTLPENWAAQKAAFQALRGEPGGEVVADLVAAHRIRASVHNALPEDDHFELESFFVGLMRAALLTFLEVRRTDGTISVPAADTQDPAYPSQTVEVP
ncbi:hypothetical protein HNQ36_003478 [Afipia massiliensis]|uniref:Uncharacterized protein n=1 Tax=Afipia massiliensis TaxID=211460 RepID=A0A840N6M2_9BRAD|nr:hypothetical protein [Afipia massiliensis]MBB5053478.1 hypothetical protein [Afipia massiliensis]